MEEQEFKRKLARLSQIKPREEWVVLTRHRLLDQAATQEVQVLQDKKFWAIIEGIIRVARGCAEKPAFVIASLAFVVGIGGIWTQTEGSLPGDTLYPLRSAVQEAPVRFSNEENRPYRELRLAQQRLADLRQVAEENKVKNLPSAIRAFQANVSDVAENVEKIVENQPEHALQAGKEVVQLQREKLEVERILGTKIGEEQEAELTNVTRKIVEYELSDLETRSLREEQQLLLEQAKELVKEERYADALETIWKVSQEG